MGKESGTLSGEMGVITNIADPLRPANWLRAGNNINVIKAGLLTSRLNGWTQHREDVFNSGGEFKDFAVFTDADGDRFLLFQCGEALYEYDLITQTETQINDADNFDATRPPCMRMFAPDPATPLYMVYCNGVDEPWKITGVTAGDYTELELNGSAYPQALAAPLPAKTMSKPKFCVQFLDRMVFAGFTGDGCFDVMISDSGDPESVTQSAPLVATDGGLFQVDPSLGPITALYAFKLSNEGNDQVVLIGQSHGVSILTGRDAEEFQVFTLTDEYGIPSNRALIRLGSDVYFVADDGVRQFSTLVSNANLINATLTYPVQDLVQGFNDGALLNAHAVHHRGYQEIQFWFPHGSDTECKNGLIFSYNVDPLTVTPQPRRSIFTRDGTSVACSIYFNKTFFGGGYDGVLQQHHSGNTYNGETIKWTIGLSMIQPAEIGVLCTLERARIVCVGGTQKFIVDAAYYAEQADGSHIIVPAKPRDAVVFSSAGSGLVLGSWRLGIDSFAGDHTRWVDFRPRGKGYAWEIDLKGTDSDHTIDFLALKYKIDAEEFDE